MIENFKKSYDVPDNQGPNRKGDLKKWLNEFFLDSCSIDLYGFDFWYVATWATLNKWYQMVFFCSNGWYFGFCPVTLLTSFLNYPFVLYRKKTAVLAKKVICQGLSRFHFHLTILCNTGWLHIRNRSNRPIDHESIIPLSHCVQVD